AQEDVRRGRVPPFSVVKQMLDAIERLQRELERLREVERLRAAPDAAEIEQLARYYEHGADVDTGIAGELAQRDARLLGKALRALQRERTADEPSDDLAFPLDARVREVFGQTEGTIVAIDSRYEVECTDGKHRFYWHRQLERVAETKNSVETAPEGRGVRDNPPPHAVGSSEGADTHSRLAEPDGANVAKPHDDPTAHRVADLRAQSQPTDEPPAVDVAPIAKLTVRDGLVQRAGLYAPGLPDGDHDVFPVPLPKGELRPHVLAEPPSAP